MNPPRRSHFPLIAGLLLLLLAGFAFWRPYVWQRDYGEAEPLVRTIWPLAVEMKRFSEEHGRSPASLDEIAAFAPGSDFTALRRYPHEFQPTGPQRFFLRVNSRFAFVVDDQFQPAWWKPPAVFGGPQQVH